MNLLVAAFRSDHAQHQTARTWLDHARDASAAGQQTSVLLPAVVSGFLRNITNPRVFSQPDDIGDAIAFIDSA